VPARPASRSQAARRAEAPRVSAAQEPLAIGLPDEAARARLEDRIAAHLPKGRLALAITDNCYTMIAVKRGRGTYRVRLHHMFLEADPVVVRALARYVADNDRRASGLLGRYIDAHQGHIRREERKAPAPTVIETRGQVHDLKTIFDELNARFFRHGIQARITWGEGLRRRPRRHSSIKMGSYSVEDRLIRVHPSLDRPFVPRYFVEWIVFHEMLHQVFEIPVVKGRRQFHTRRFREAEARFPRHVEAARWEKAHLNELLQY
jgi:predicted metal-dependent hydrolase